MSPDGKTVTRAAAAAGLGPSQSCRFGVQRRLGLLQYPAAGPGHVRTLYTSPLTCAASYVIETLWASSPDGTLIGYLNTGRAGVLSPGGQFGVVSGGRFKPLPAPPTNYPDYGVAW